MERDAAGRVVAEVQRLYRQDTSPTELLVEFEHRLNAMGHRQASRLQGLGEVGFMLYGAGYIHGLTWLGQSLMD